MNTYLVFDSSGNLKEMLTAKILPSDENTYIDVKTLDFEPNLVENIYTLVDGSVVYEPIPEYVIPESEHWDLLRLRRNNLLTESDWTQIADSSADAAAWAVYRQQLRDLPSNTTDPQNPVWPSKPE